MRHINYLVLILLFSLLFIIACSNAETPTGDVIKEPEKPPCNKPYFEFRESYCCLDKNDNSVCDKDEENEKEGVEVADPIPWNIRVRWLEVEDGGALPGCIVRQHAKHS